MISLVQSMRGPLQPKGPALGCLGLVGCIKNIAYIIVGASKLDECPVQSYIPVYLIVMGVFSLQLALLDCLSCAQEPEDGTSNPLSRACMGWNTLTSLFIFCWFIAGNVWIYSIYEPLYTKNATHAERYCDRTLYLFAFWTTTLGYILSGLTLVCLFYLYGHTGPNDPDDHV